MPLPTTCSSLGTAVSDTGEQPDNPFVSPEKQLHHHPQPPLFLATVPWTTTGFWHILLVLRGFYFETPTFREDMHRERVILDERTTFGGMQMVGQP